MTAFEDFVTTEIPRRSVFLTEDITSWDDDPNSVSAPAIIASAPLGTWFYELTADTYWRRGPAAWEEAGDGGSGPLQEGYDFGGPGLGAAIVAANGPLQVTVPSVGAGDDASILVDNPALAVAGVQQKSPSLKLRGQGFNTQSFASVDAGWSLQASPVERVGAPPSVDLSFGSEVGGVFVDEKLKITSEGSLVFPFAGSADQPSVNLMDPGLGLFRSGPDQLSLVTDSLESLRLDSAQNALFAGEVQPLVDKSQDVGIVGNRWRSVKAESLDLDMQAVGATQALGMLLANPDAATVSLTQNSPMFVQRGAGFKTTAVAASQVVQWGQQVEPVQSTNFPQANLVFTSSIENVAAGAFIDIAKLSFNGTIGSLFMANGATSRPAFSFLTDEQSGLSSGGPGQLVFSTNAHEAMRLDASQNALFAGNAQLGVGQRLVLDDDGNTYITAALDNFIQTRVDNTVIQQSSSSSTTNFIQHSFLRSGLGSLNTSNLVDAVRLMNQTASTLGNPENSPAIRLQGSAFKTDAVAESQLAAIRLQARPIEGALNPMVDFSVQAEIDGVSADMVKFRSDGKMLLNTAGGTGGAGIFEPSGVTGFGIVSGSQMRFYFNSATIFQFQQSGLRVNQAGSESSPSIRLNDAGTGLFRPAGNQLGISTNSLEALRLDDSQNAIFAADISAVGGLGLHGNPAAAQSAAYTRDAVAVEDRTLLASASATAANNNNVLAALIADLQATGILG